MKLSTTLLLALLLTGLGTYYVVSEKMSQEAEAELQPLKILTLSEGDSVLWLRIENRVSKETFSLRREGPDWRLEFPVSYPAEKFLVEGMASALTLSFRLRRFPLVGKDPPGSGLDTPDIMIRVETEKGTRRRTLLLGNESPVKGSIYARWQGEAEYFLIPSPVKAAMERSVYSLRQKRLFRVNWDGVAWLHVKVDPKEFRIEKKGEGWRFVLPPLQAEIPVEKVEDLIYAFESFYVKEFLDGKDPARSEFGLKGQGSFLAAGTPEGTSEKLILGASAEEKEGRYALREGEGLVLLISQGKLRLLLETFEAALGGDESKQNASSAETQGDSGENSESRSAGAEEPRGGRDRVGHEERSGRTDSGGSRGRS